MPTTTLSAAQPADIAECLRGRPGRVLVFGEMGVGKSTLVAELAQWLFRSGSGHMVIGADPGLPAFGIPGAVCGGRWRGDGFQLTAWEALCSLNAGRFRLPLIQAFKRLMASIDAPLLLIDAPGITRGVAGAELLAGLIETAAVDTVLLVVREGKPGPLMTELKASGVAIWHVTASDKARPLSSRGRMRHQAGKEMSGFPFKQRFRNGYRRLHSGAFLPCLSLVIGSIGTIFRQDACRATRFSCGQRHGSTGP